MNNKVLLNAQMILKKMCGETQYLLSENMIVKNW